RRPPFTRFPYTTLFRSGFGEKFGGAFEIGDRGGFVGKAQGVETALAAGADGAGGRVEGERGFACDVMAEKGFEIGRIERGGGARSEEHTLNSSHVKNSY